jgi:hypothetical protein
MTGLEAAANHQHAATLGLLDHAAQEILERGHVARSDVDPALGLEAPDDTTEIGDDVAHAIGAVSGERRAA